MNEQKELEVGSGSVVLPVPPIVSQTHVVLPDGVIDPQAANDCGEACVSSVLAGMRGMLVSPGCWRQALGGTDRSGLTSPDDLCALLRGVGVNAKSSVISVERIWDRLHRLRRTGSYVIVLGYWITMQELHWVVAYEGDGDLVRVMDPWTARYDAYTRSKINYLYQDVAVEVYG